MQKRLSVLLAITLGLFPQRSEDSSLVLFPSHSPTFFEPAQVARPGPYWWRMDSSDVAAIDDLKGRLITEFDQDSAFVFDVLDHDSVQMYSRVDSFINNIFPKSDKPWTYQTYLDNLNIDSMKIAAKEFFDDNVVALNGAYERYGVDPRVIVGHYGIETWFHINLGKYNWVSSFVTQYARADSRWKRERALKWLSNAMDYAKLRGWDVEEFMKQKGSWVGAYSGAQFMPDMLFALYRGEDGTLEGSDPAGSITDNIYAIAHYLSNNGWCNWNPKYNGEIPRGIKRNKRSSYAYNRSLWYVNAVWNEIAESLPYRSPEEMRELANHKILSATRPMDVDWLVPEFVPPSKEFTKPLNTTF